jgi:putative ABC transport system permease protein
MLEAFQTAFRRLLRKPLRSILTILAVALGSLAVTLALNLMQGREAAALPPDVFRVVSGNRGNGAFTIYQLFTNDDLEKLRKLIPDAEVVETYLPAYISFLEYNSQRFKLLSSAHVNPGYFGAVTINMEKGGSFTRNDITSGTQPIVMSQSVASQVFFGENPLGKLVLLSTEYVPPGSIPSFETYQVTGVFRDPPINSFNADFAYVPFKENMGRSSTDPLLLTIKAKPGLTVSTQNQALQAIRAIYKNDEQFLQNKGSLYITTSNNLTEENPVFDPQALIFSGFAIIMLITCSIGIFSIQLVEITERTREIGMRRALGATQSMIVLEILASAFVFAGLGALIGVTIAAPLLPIIKNATGPFLFSRGLEFSPVVALEVVSIVLVVGVMLGFYPALLASRLKPVEALREM